MIERFVTRFIKLVITDWRIRNSSSLLRKLVSQEAGNNLEMKVELSLGRKKSDTPNARRHSFKNE